MSSSHTPDKYSEDSEMDSSSSSSEGDSDQSALTYSKVDGQTTTDHDMTLNGDEYITETEYKKRSETCLETLTLTKNEFQDRIKGAGFRTDGRPRQIKRDTLLAKVRTRCRIRDCDPAVAICITMYNEEETELKATLRGLIHNYNCIRAQ